MHTYIHTYIHTHTHIYIYTHTHITPHTHSLSFIHSGCKPRYRSSLLFGHSNLNQLVVTLTMAVTVTVTVTMTVAVTVTVTVSVTVDVTVTVTLTMTVTATITVALTVEIANTRRHTFMYAHVYICTWGTRADGQSVPGPTFPVSLIKSPRRVSDKVWGPVTVAVLVPAGL
jgi:hypothetical protein